LITNSHQSSTNPSINKHPTIIKTAYFTEQSIAEHFSLFTLFQFHARPYIFLGLNCNSSHRPNYLSYAKPSPDKKTRL
ncbi:hypothetical protein LINPERHAP1_LOCUS18247, partial [Linum perenne]